MNNLNSVLVEGALIADPKLHHTAKVRLVCEFTINSKRYFEDDSEKVVEDSSNFDVVCFDRLAEICAEQLKKGRGVRVMGRLQEYQRPLNPLETVARIFKVHIIAEHVEFKPVSKEEQGE